MKRRIIFLILTIAWMIIIFSFSAKPADESEDMSLSVGYTIGKIFVPEFDSWSPEEQQAFAEQIDYPVRKCAHATEYAILGILLSGTVVGQRSGDSGERTVIRKDQNHPRFFQFLFCFVIGAAYAASDEFHQLFVPGRAGQVKDVLIDSGGVMLGLLAACLMMIFWRRMKVRMNPRGNLPFEA